jgi:hypothetical protein
MVLHIIKLCVGVDSFEELDHWIKGEVARAEAVGMAPETTHTTRMYPRRAAEIIGEGSLYWVIKGLVQARQLITDIRPNKGDDGIERCDLVLDPQLVRTEIQPRRPFQGWRYLDPKDAPPDMRQIKGADDMPPDMRRALVELALI